LKKGGGIIKGIMYYGHIGNYRKNNVLRSNHGTALATLPENKKQLKIDKKNKSIGEKHIKFREKYYKELEDGTVKRDGIDHVITFSISYDDHYTPMNWQYDIYDLYIMEGIILEPNILNDKNSYWFYNPVGKIWNIDYLRTSVPGPNIKKILRQDNMVKYIEGLDVEQGVKDGLLFFVPQFEKHKKSVNNIMKKDDPLKELNFVMLKDLH